TSERVADLIEQEFGVRYHPGHVWKILVALGWSATKRPSVTGRRSVGRTLKKSPKRGANDCLSRRKRTEPAAAPLPDMVAAGPHTGATVSLQLENAFGHRGHHAVECLLPVLSRSDPRATDRGISQTSAAAHSRQAAAGVGPPPRASQPSGAGVRGRAEGPDPHRVPAGLCSGVESHRIHLGLLQAPQTPQRLPQGLLRIEKRRPSRTPEYAPPPHPDHRFLETGFFMARMTLYYAELSSSNSARLSLSSGILDFLSVSVF